MKNLLSIFLTALTLSQALAQTRTIESQIQDGEGNGIPFAAIGIAEKNFGAVTFEDGSFSIEVNDEFLGDTLVIYAIGYEQKKIAYSDFVNREPDAITVTEEPVELDEVVITPGPIELARMGEKRLEGPGNLTFFEPLEGMIMAVPFNEERELVQIKEIRVGTGRENLRRFQLRCMVFEYGEDGLPGKQLLKENIIESSANRRGGISFKLEKELWIDEPFFVGFEWIVSRSQFEEIQRIKEKHPLEFITEIEERFPHLQLTMDGTEWALMKNQEGEVIEKVQLNLAQQERLALRDEYMPHVFFQIHYKGGLRTYSGSYILDAWWAHNFSPIVSLKVLKRRN